MTMTLLDMLGLSAGSLTTLSFIPQVLKTWHSKSADDISTGMFGLFSVGVMLWLIYGIYLHSLPIILANAITLVLSIAILVLKYYYTANRE